LVDDRSQPYPYHGFIPNYIAANPPTIPAGQSLTVSGFDFKPNFSTALLLDWNKVVWGAPQTTVYMATLVPQYGFIPMGTFPINPTGNGNPYSWQPTGLSPSTTYQFMVRECDQVTCAPWSNGLVTSTDAASATKVNFTLPENPLLCAVMLGQSCAIPIGNATLNAGGGFVGPATIPGNTQVGLHTISATVGGQQASTQINVCDPKGCAPSLWLQDSSTGKWVSSGLSVAQGGQFTVEGFSFAPGQTVDITFDSPQGLNAGYASAGQDGSLSRE
jgi:hypothetical protein